jgi:segregation and condensation protein B
MERGLVRIGGEEDSLGRPFLYETTRRFLELFGLTDLDELPNAVLLRRPPQRSEPSGDDGMTEESVEDEEVVDEGDS